jgi:outer membrane protein assembly factor BamB
VLRKQHPNKSINTINYSHMKPLFPLLPLCIVLTIISCDNNIDPDPSDPSTPGSPIKVVWKRDYPTDQLYASSMPTFFEDKVIFSNYPAFDPEKFYAVDAATGQSLKWEWNDYMNTTTRNAAPDEEFNTQEEVMVMRPANGLIGVDMRTGATLWKKNFSTYGLLGRFETSVISLDNHYYETGVSSLRFVDIKTGQERVAIKIDTSSTTYGGFGQATAERDHNGDTILYVGYNQLFKDQDGIYNQYKSKFLCYNITKGQMKWLLNNTISYRKPIIVNNNIYIQSLDTLCCINKLTGERIWQRTSYVKSSQGQIEYIDGRLIHMGSSSPSRVEAYNPVDGSVIWSFTFGGADQMPVLYKGYLYFVCRSDGRLWAIRSSDGTRVLHEFCPNKDIGGDRGWAFAVNVDPVRDKLYLSSLSAFYCIEPYKE